MDLIKKQRSVTMAETGWQHGQSAFNELKM